MTVFSWMAGSSQHKAGHDGGGSPSTVIAISARLYLDKIRNLLYVLSLTESLPLGADRGRARRSCGCLKTLAQPQPARELKGRRRFPYFLVRNPLKRLDSEK
jgi:hypothetical protein